MVMLYLLKEIIRLIQKDLLDQLYSGSAFATLLKDQKEIGQQVMLS